MASGNRTGTAWMAVAALVLLAVGGVVFSQSRSDLRTQEIISSGGGVQTIATITNAEVSYGSHNRLKTYSIALAWQDLAGLPRKYGPTHVSLAYWQKITHDDVQTVATTRLTYLNEDASARPVIMDDAEERQFQDTFGVYAGGAMLFGAAILALFLTRRLIGI